MPNFGKYNLDLTFLNFYLLFLVIFKKKMYYCYEIKISIRSMNFVEEN